MAEYVSLDFISPNSLYNTAVPAMQEEASTRPIEDPFYALGRSLSAIMVKKDKAEKGIPIVRGPLYKNKSSVILLFRSLNALGGYSGFVKKETLNWLKRT